MEKLKQYKYIVLITLVILGAVFYWLEFRPYLVKKSCFRDTLPTYYSDPSDNLSLWERNKEQYDDIYALCLKKNGI